MNSKVQILIGVEGIKKAYTEALKGKALDIICLASNYEAVLGSWFDAEYSPKLYQLQTREILPDTVENRAFAKSKDAQKNAVKFLAGASSQSDVVLGENVAILISYDEQEPVAVTISDKELVMGLKSQFEVMWEAL